MMSNYVIDVYVNFLSWHVYGSLSVYLPKPGVTHGEGSWLSTELLVHGAWPSRGLLFA